MGVLLLQMLGVGVGVGVGTILTLDTLVSALTVGAAVVVGVPHSTTLDTLLLAATLLSRGTRDTRALAGILDGDATDTLPAAEGRVAPPASTMVSRTLSPPAAALLHISHPGSVFCAGLVFCGVPQGEAPSPTLLDSKFTAPLRCSPSCSLSLSPPTPSSSGAGGGGHGSSSLVWSSQGRRFTSWGTWITLTPPTCVPHGTTLSSCCRLMRRAWACSTGVGGRDLGCLESEDNTCSSGGRVRRCTLTSGRRLPGRASLRLSRSKPTLSNPPE